MKAFHVFPYLNPVTTRSIQNAWRAFCDNPTEEIKENLCNKIRHYFMKTPMMPPEGRRLMNSLSNDNLLENCYYELITGEGLPSQDTLVFKTSQGLIRVWCTLKSFLNKSMYGELLGYSTCCVTYYNNTSVTALKPVYEQRDPALGKIGFVPCPSCIKKPVNEVIEGILNRRYFNEHVEIGEHVITAIANELMVSAYREDVEPATNDYYNIQTEYPDLILVGVLDELYKWLKISKFTV